MGGAIDNATSADTPTSAETTRDVRRAVILECNRPIPGMITPRRVKIDKPISQRRQPDVAISAPGSVIPRGSSSAFNLSAGSTFFSSATWRIVLPVAWASLARAAALS